MCNYARATLHKVKPLHKVKVKPCAIAQGEAHKVKLLHKVNVEQMDHAMRLQDQ